MWLLLVPSRIAAPSHIPCSLRTATASEIPFLKFTPPPPIFASASPQMREETIGDDSARRVGATAVQSAGTA